MKQRVYKPTVEPPERFPHTDAFANAFDAWQRFLYPRRGFFFAWGFFFWAWMLWVAFKGLLFAAGAVLLFVGWMIACVWDLATYPRRMRIAGWGKALS